MFPQDDQQNQKDIYTRYELLRSYIVHEDTLINHRLTWLLVIQGLIFSAYSNLLEPMVSLKGDTKNQLFRDLHNLQSLLAILGILVSFAIYPGIIAAYRAILKIQEDNPEEQFPKLPRLTGGGALKNLPFGAFTHLIIPGIIIIGWILILGEMTISQKIVMFSVGTITGITLTVICLWRRYGLPLHETLTNSKK